MGVSTKCMRRCVGGEHANMSRSSWILQRALSASISQPYLREQLLHIHPSASCCSPRGRQAASPPPPPPPPSLPHAGGDKTPCVSLRSYLSSRPARRCEVLTKPDRRKSLIPALLIILYFFCCFYPESLDFNSPLQMSQLYFPVPAPRKITHKPNKRN